jgi:hypothetical protein
MKLGAVLLGMMALANEAAGYFLPFKPDDFFRARHQEIRMKKRGNSRAKVITQAAAAKVRLACRPLSASPARPQHEKHRAAP